MASQSKTTMFKERRTVTIDSLATKGKSYQHGFNEITD